MCITYILVLMEGRQKTGLGSPVTRAAMWVLGLGSRSFGRTSTFPLLHFLFFFFFFFQTGFFCVTVLAVLELVLVDQAGLKLRELPVCSFQVLGLEVCATILSLLWINPGAQSTCDLSFQSACPTGSEFA